MKWWMGHYKGCTPKRHWAYCNSRAIHRLDKGVLQGWKKGSSKKVVTAEHYIDGKGKKRYKGTSKLKGTETLDKLRSYQFEITTLFWETFFKCELLPPRNIFTSYHITTAFLGPQSIYNMDKFLIQCDKTYNHDICIHDST